MYYYMYYTIRWTFNTETSASCVQIVWITVNVMNYDSLKKKYFFNYDNYFYINIA